MSPSSILVVGADGFIGNALMQACRVKGIRTIGTTRRQDRLAEEMFFCDLCDSDPLADLPLVKWDVTTAVICAAVSRFETCETDPLAFRVNVEAPLSIAHRLEAEGIFVVFLSTDSVFGGERPLCDESITPAPSAAYSSQKAMAERELLNLARERGMTAIARLTKVVSADREPFSTWIERLKTGAFIRPFSDLICSPISVDYAVNGIIKLASVRQSGLFHLSGQEDVSYADLAVSLAQAMRVDPALVIPQTSLDAGFELHYRPHYSSMGMVRTTEILGIRPQSLNRAIASLVP